MSRTTGLRPDGTSTAGTSTAGSGRRLVRPYGDTTGDGMVQVSFTLPVPHDKRAEGAALALAAAMGLDPALLVHAAPVGEDFTFFVVYGAVRHLVDLDAVEVAERDFPLLTASEINTTIRRHLHRKMVVVGACIGTDATRSASTRSCPSRGSPARRGWSTTAR